MRVGEIIQRVQSKFSSGVQDDSVWLSNRYVYNILLSARNTLFEQSANKKQYISDWNFQTLPCVEMIEVPLVDCPGMPKLPYTILRTKHELPRVVSNLSGDMMGNIFAVDGLTKIDKGNFSTAKYRDGNKYTSNRPVFFIRNKYGWIQGTKIPAVLIGPALFEDPIEAMMFPSFCEENVPSCTSYLDLEFPADSDMARVLVGMVTDEIIAGFSQGAKQKQQEEAQPNE